MKLIIGDNAFVIKFNYPKDVQTNRPLGDSYCYLRVGPANQPGSTLSERILETQTRKKKAQFTYADGRLVSFKKLLDLLFEDKELRKKYNLKSYHKSIFMRCFQMQCPNTFRVTSTKKYPHLWPKH